MYKGRCILALRHTARVPVARHMRLDTVNAGPATARRKDDLARSARYDALLASARTVHCMQLAESFRTICYGLVNPNLDIEPRADMHMPPGAAESDECGSGDHPDDTASVNV